MKNLYNGEVIQDAANHVGRAEPIENRWADNWNEGRSQGPDLSFGGSRPP